MKKKNNHTDINTHLIEQELLDYNNGVLGNDKMYRLELHLNECELCCDALDGIGLINNPEEILSSVSNQFLPNNNKYLKNNYLAIAASITLIAVFGLSYWLLTNTSNEKNLALNNKPEEEKVIERPKPIKEESKEITEVPKEKPETEILTDDTAIDNAPSTPVIAAISEKSQIDETINKEKLIAVNSSEQVEEEIAEELDADINIIQADKEEIQGAISDNSGNNQGVALQSAPSAARSAKKTAGKPSIILKDQKEPIPKEGLSDLKTYISNNLKYPKEALDNKIKGTVVLEVTISADGTIKNIIIIKSVGSGCDIEAMRLITSGPIWNPAILNGKAIEAKRQLKVKFKY